MGCEGSAPAPPLLCVPSGCLPQPVPRPIARGHPKNHIRSHCLLIPPKASPASSLHSAPAHRLLPVPLAQPAPPRPRASAQGHGSRLPCCASSKLPFTSLGLLPVLLDQLMVPSMSLGLFVAPITIVTISTSLLGAQDCGAGLTGQGVLGGLPPRAQSVIWCSASLQHKCLE